MEIKVILVSHKGFASGLKEAVEFILGSQENLFAYELDGQGIEVFNKKIKNIKKTESQQIILVSDIPSGSPGNNAYTILSEEENVVFLTGMNLAMIIELLIGQESKSIDNLVRDSLEGGKQSMVLISTEVSEEEDNEF